MSVGVMKDYKLKLRKLRAPHTLGLPSPVIASPVPFTVRRKLGGEKKHVAESKRRKGL